ncbi:MAG: hypothetical protein WC628_04810 [Candidatus Omnitrophota bacterium]
MTPFVLAFVICHSAFAQQSDDLEFTLDVQQDTVALPKIFKPGIDLSGRGSSRDISWPQALAAPEVLESWKKEIGFSGLYRLQFNLWEINQLAKDTEAQSKLLANYDLIIKDITAAGGTIILDIFGTPAGLGKVLDKKAPPWDTRAMKALVKGIINDFSCQKRYNIWYEVWNAPDLDDFFLGRKQEYFNLYRAVAESAAELKSEYQVHIPVGGPSVSWWFQNLDGNTPVNPEKSLIYELMKFCYHNHLPLDFISWHAYTTDPKAEKENTVYSKKPAVQLIREWLSYFSFDPNTPLVIDEWNYDRGANVLAERGEKSYIAASFIPSRIKNMHKAGIDRQLYFSLQDFQDNPEGVTRNTGIWEYKEGPKVIFNAFKMLGALQSQMFPLGLSDDFAGVIATAGADEFAILIYNYIDPEAARNHLAANIAGLNSSERRSILNIINSESWEKILGNKLEIESLRLTNKARGLLKKALELHSQAEKFVSQERKFKLKIKNLKDSYFYQSYSLGSGCSINCPFYPQEQKEVSASDAYEEDLLLKPYSLRLIVLKRKPVEIEPPAVTQAPVEQVSNATQPSGQ